MGKPTAIITDVKYRMTPSVIRDLGESGVRVVACHRAGGDDPPLGFYSKHAAQKWTISPFDYEDALYDICYNIYKSDGARPALLPIGAATLALFANSSVRKRFSSVCGLLIPTTEQLALLNNKSLLSALADSLDIPIPRSYFPETTEAALATETPAASIPNAMTAATGATPASYASMPNDVAAAADAFESVADSIPLPCIVKPRWGEGLGLTALKRYVIARTKDELIHAFMYFSELAHEPPIVQEYLPGSGYGCSVLAKRGEIIRSICHRRIREYPVSGGPSTCCDVISAPHLEAMAEQIARAIGLNGPAMFEFKDDADGHPRLLECNPRVWGSYPLTRVSKSGFSYAWFVLSYNAANPDALLPLPQRPEIMKRRMVFFPSDFAAAKGYLRSGNKKLALGAVADFLNPSVKDGLFEWRDMRPAFSYWRSLTKR